MFTAKDLKEVLKNIPDDMPLVLQTDDEGNGYRYVRGLEFIAEGKNKNFFHPEEKECYRQSDFDEDEEKSKEGFVLCAVVY